MAKPQQFRRYDVLSALQQDERASLRELCVTCDIRSTSQVYVLLKELEREGLITRKAGARMVYLTNAGRKFHWEMAKPSKRSVSIKRSHHQRGEMALPRLSKEELAARIEQVVAKAMGKPVSSDQSAVIGGRQAVADVLGHSDRLGGCKVG